MLTSFRIFTTFSKKQQINDKNKNNNKRKMYYPIYLIIFFFIGIFCGLFLVLFFANAPILCASTLTLLYVIGLYFGTESGRWRWHDAQEFENRFWTAAAFFSSTIFFFADDSPFPLGRYNIPLGSSLVIIFTLAIQYYDRAWHREQISRIPKLKTDKLPQHKGHLQYKATAEEKANVVKGCVEQIDRMYLPSTINNMISINRVKCQEQKIYRILSGASKEELNYIVTNVRLALLFYKVKDHSYRMDEQYRTLIADLLCTKRLADLSITSRAVVLDALMVMRISAHKYSEKWVKNIIINTYGDDLSDLKTFTDTKGDVHSMHKLIFNDIRNEEIRNDILTHIKKQAAVQLAHMKLGTRYSSKRKQRAWRKVLSDVDDTLYSSGGRYPAGMDTRFPKHALYPGVLSFYRELDMGLTGPDTWEEGRVGNLVFVSARPHIYKDVSEKKSYKKFQLLYDQMQMHTLATLLAGNLQSGRAYIMQGDLEPMAYKKYENFSQYLCIYPEFQHVFIGDNGQADVRAAEMIFDNYGDDALEAAYFHQVQPIDKTYGYQEKNNIDPSSDTLNDSTKQKNKIKKQNSNETIKFEGNQIKMNHSNKNNKHSNVHKWKKLKIFFFQTYIGAAVQAYLLQHIRLGGLYRVAESAKEQFYLLDDKWPNEESREKVRILLNNDIEKANKILGYTPESSHHTVPNTNDNNTRFPKINYLEKKQLYPEQSIVCTKYGKAKIKNFRGVEGLYHVELIDWKLSNDKQFAQAFLTTESISDYLHQNTNHININNNTENKNVKDELSNKIHKDVTSKKDPLMKTILVTNNK